MNSIIDGEKTGKGRMQIGAGGYIESPVFESVTKITAYLSTETKDITTKAIIQYKEDGRGWKTFAVSEVISADKPNYLGCKKNFHEACRLPNPARPKHHKYCAFGL